MFIPIGIIYLSHNCCGIAARACGLVCLEPSKVVNLLKDRSSWFHVCRSLNVVNVIPTGNGEIKELVYMQTYAPTTLTPARDFWTMRYTTTLEDDSLVICERSLTPAMGGPSGPAHPNLVRAEMLPSGFLVRPCEDGSIIYIVDHVDLNASSVPEVLRPLSESPKLLAQAVTISALRYLRQISQETGGKIIFGEAQESTVLRDYSLRLNRGFNDALNGLADDGWSLMSNDDAGDIIVAINSSPTMFFGSYAKSVNMPPCIEGGILCAKASMLLQDVPPALLVCFLKEHRSEWADCSVESYSVEALKVIPYAVHGARTSASFRISHVTIPLANTMENEEILEVIRIERHDFNPEEVFASQLQLCSELNENAVGACAQLLFAPIDESFADNASLLPSGFRVIPLDLKRNRRAATQTLDPTCTLETGFAAHATTDSATDACNRRSVLTIAFQFIYEKHLLANVAAMARKYIGSVVTSVQRISMAITTSCLDSHLGSKQLPDFQEAFTLAQLICRSYRLHTGVELLRIESQPAESLLELPWHHCDVILCFSFKSHSSSPVCTFENKSAVDMCLKPRCLVSMISLLTRYLIRMRVWL